MELSLDALSREWKAGSFRPAYYLFGEPLAVGEAVKALEAAVKPDPFNLSRFSSEVDSQAQAIISEALTPPAFGPRRLVIVDSFKLSVASRAEFTRYLEDPLATTTIVFLSDERKADPKDALTRAVLARGAVCVLGTLKEDEAQRRLVSEAQKAGRALSADAARCLVEEAGTDWSLLRQELEKALLFAKEKKSIERPDILSCLGYQKSVDPFALPRLIQKRDMKASLIHLRKLFRQGKADDAAFGSLRQITQAVQKQFRAKSLLKAGRSADDISRTLRLHSYWDRDYLAEVARFPEARLRDDLYRCLETETSLKSKTWLDPRIELEGLVIALCAKGYLAATEAS